MKLSEAIRKGAEMRPQFSGRWFSELADGTVASCAQGAAYEAVFNEIPEWNEEPPTNLSGYVRGHVARSDEWNRLEAAFPGVQGGIFHRIAHKNDRDWTREEIADWLDEQGL